MKIYLICPVRNITEEQQKGIKRYVYETEQSGDVVHYPPRDVNQDDPLGVNICKLHRQAVKDCDEVHIFWDSTSKGSHFDFGMAFALGKPIKLIKHYQPDIAEKSYLKVNKFENISN